MKQSTLVKILAAVCAVGLSTALAQTSTTTTSTNPVTGTTTSSTVSSAGTITTYSPSSDYITFRSTTDTAPVRYYYNKETTVVDPEGRTVTWSAVRPDLPATVYYTRDGDRMIVHRVVLSKPTVIEKETTTTVTTEKRR